MLYYDWNFYRLIGYLKAFEAGILTTIELSLATIAFATLLGVSWGILLTRNGMFAALTSPISYLLRALPPLVLVLFGYYLYTEQIVGFTLNGFLTFVFSVGFNIAAFIADVTRSAISNTPEEFLDLGRSMGLSDRQMLWRIIAPIAFREILAPLTYLYVESIKVTSLASVINVHETVYVGQAVITDTSRSLEVWVIIAVVYCIIVLPLMIVARRLERHVKLAAGLWIR